MGVKARVRELLLADAQFALVIPDARLFNAGSIQSTPDLKVGKFAVLRFDPTVRGVGTLSRTPFFVYAYDVLGGGYAAIDAVLERARVALDGVGATMHSDGWISNIKWTGKGPETIDDTWRASVSWAEFEVVYSGT
jgi:hypothetical protein